MNATCFSTVSERTFVYAQLQEKIDVSEQDLLTYKRRYNELNLTMRLPDELLSEIFTWNLIIRRHKTREFGEYCTDVAAVCSHWRRIALSQPRLWNTYYFEWALEWLTEIVIPRSQQAPLNIHLTLKKNNNSRWDDVQAILAGHYHRIQSLSLTDMGTDLDSSHYTKNDLERLLSKLTVASMPILRCFKVVFEGGFQYSLPRNFFDRMTQLRTIALVACQPFDSIHLSTLTSLTLGTWRNGEPRISFVQLMKILRAACNLNDLDLRRACIVPLSDIHDRGIFPTIETLNIQDGARECLVLLSCIECPRVQRLDINTSRCFEGNIDGAPQKLFDRLITYIQIRRLIFQYHDSVSFYGVQSADATQTLAIKVSLRGINDMLLKSSLITLSCLSKLVLKRSLPSNSLEKQFGTLHSLRTLHIWGIYIDNLISMLVPQIASNTLLAWFSKVASIPEMVNAPSGEQTTTALQAIAQDHIHLKLIKRLIIADGSFSPSGVTMLAAYLHLRHVVGLPLKELHVTGITYSGLPNVDRDLSWIRKSVNTVYWNVRKESVPRT
ncbi:hypothetical protein H0H93_015284 [Arthromyces matolae]|nr:hypothetical protein H0H93_015284 [Arthromyces matolae]